MASSPQVSMLYVENKLKQKAYRESIVAKFAIGVLYGDSVLVPIRMGTNMVAGNQQKHLSLRFAQKRVFISRGTKKHENDTFSNTWTVQIAKFHEKSHLINQHDISLNRHIHAASHKIQEPFGAKICQLLLYIMKVKSHEDQ